MSVKLANNAETSLSSAISATNTVIAVEDGALFPTLAADEWFPLTLEDSAGNREIVHVTARTGNALTVNRAQEGTSAQDFAQGTHASLRLTAAVVADLATQIEANNGKFLPLSGGTLTGGIALKDGAGVFFPPEQGGQTFKISYVAGLGLVVFVQGMAKAIFKLDGNLQITGKFYCDSLYCGDTYLSNDGNIWGTEWLDWDEDGGTTKVGDLISVEGGLGGGYGYGSAAGTGRGYAVFRGGNGGVAFMGKDNGGAGEFSYYGGGGGGGGRSVYQTTQPGGGSVYGGSGGAVKSNGQIPGGGGGAHANGAQGKVILRILK